MFNVTQPSICHVIEAGRSVDISIPGTYNIVPINLEEVVSNFLNKSVDPQHTYSESQDIPENPSLLDIASSASSASGAESEKSIPSQIAGSKIEPLFTKNLAELISMTRSQ